MYGAGHVWAGLAHFHLHDHSIEDSATDAQFTQMLSENCRLNGPDFPPPSYVEVLKDYMSPISTKCAVSTSWWLTCGDHGGTMPGKLSKSQTTYGLCVTNRQQRGWCRSCQVVAALPFGAADMSMDMPSTIQNFHVTWFGRSGTETTVILSLIPRLRMF